MGSDGLRRDRHGSVEVADLMLYGRDLERSAITALLDGTRAACGGALVLRGRAGAGKSALLDDAVAAAAGMRVLRAAGVGSNAPAPSWRTASSYAGAVGESRREPTCRQPHDRFEQLNAHPWAERARQELRAAGRTARKRDPSTVLQLTPQEIQVARFVARRLHTREVAAQLFLSTRTVDFHLRNVFAKLGISSRTELARFPWD
jgi:DNA-binding CsgD family transcriptional regulator